MSNYVMGPPIDNTSLEFVHTSIKSYQELEALCAEVLGLEPVEIFCLAYCSENLNSIQEFLQEVKAGRIPTNASDSNSLHFELTKCLNILKDPVLKKTLLECPLIPPALINPNKPDSKRRNLSYTPSLIYHRFGFLEGVTSCYHIAQNTKQFEVIKQRLYRWLRLYPRRPLRQHISPVFEWIGTGYAHEVGYRMFMWVYNAELDNLYKGPDFVRELVKRKLGGLKVLTKLKFKWFAPNVTHGTDYLDEKDIIIRFGGTAFYELYQWVVQQNDTAIFNYMQGLFHLEQVEKFQQASKCCDFTYFDPKLVAESPVGFLKALIKMGYTPEVFFTKLTKKEAYRYLDYLEGAVNLQRDIIGPSNAIIQFDFLFSSLASPEFVSNATRYTLNRTVLEWAVAHKSQIERKIRHINNGEIYESDSFHILANVREEDLVHGKATSFYRIKDLVTRRFYESDLPSEDTSLPVFPKPLHNPKIQQITTSDGLLQESVRMHHCVAMYYKKCVKLESYIFHVDDGSEFGVTVEVCPSQEEWVIKQCQGHRRGCIETAKEIMQTELNR